MKKLLLLGLISLPSYLLSENDLPEKQEQPIQLKTEDIQKAKNKIMASLQAFIEEITKRHTAESNEALEKSQRAIIEIQNQITKVKNLKQQALDKGLSTTKIDSALENLQKYRNIAAEYPKTVHKKHAEEMAVISHDAKLINDIFSELEQGNTETAIISIKSLDTIPASTAHTLGITKKLKKLITLDQPKFWQLRYWWETIPQQTEPTLEKQQPQKDQPTPFMEGNKWWLW